MIKPVNYKNAFQRYLWEEVLPHITRKEIADRIGMPMPTLNAYIYGRSTPPAWMEYLLRDEIIKMLEEKKWQ